MWTERQNKHSSHVLSFAFEYAEPTPAPVMVAPSATQAPQKAPAMGDDDDDDDDGKGSKGSKGSKGGKGSKGSKMSGYYYGDKYEDVDETGIDSRVIDQSPAVETTTAASATNDSNSVPIWTIPAVFAGTVVLALAIMAVRRRRTSSRGRSSSRRSRSSSRRASSSATTPSA